MTKLNFFSFEVFSMKRLLLLLSVIAFSTVFAAVRPVAVGGYHYEARRIQSDVVVKNRWIGKLITPLPRDYKNYAVVFLGEQMKGNLVSANAMWDTPEKQKQVLEYLNSGGVIVVSRDVPRYLLGKKFGRQGATFFGFSTLFSCKNKISGVKTAYSKELCDWQVVCTVAADKLSGDAEVMASYVLSNGKSLPAAVRKRIGNGQIWWISAPLNRLKEYYSKNKISLGVPDEVGRFIPSRAGESLDALEKIYNQAFCSGKDIEVNKGAKSWGDKPLGSPGNLKLNDKFRNRAKLRSGFPERKPGLVLCDDKVQAVIYSGSKMTGKLAAEIKYHLDKMSGRSFKIVNTYPAADQTAIILGGAELFKKFGVVAASAERDTVVISKKGRHLLVGGISCGISQAVTIFLESLGCRYLWPGVSGKVIPKQKNITVPELNVNHTAELYMIRSVRSNGFRDRWAGSIKKFGFTPEEMEALWNKYSIDSRSNRGFWQWHGINEDPRRFGWEKKTKQIYEWGHAFNHFYKVYGKKYPECFALQPDGSRKQPERPRLCHSNEQLIKLIVAEKVAHFKAHPYKQAVSLCLNDGGQSSMCMCINCRKLDPVNAFSANTLVFAPVRRSLKYVSLADRVLTFSNRIAEGVLKEMPDKKFTFYAYAEYERPPVKVKPHPSLIIFSVAGNYTSEVARQQALKTVASWAHFGNPMLWRPNALFGFRSAVMPQNFGRRMFDDIELFKANNIIGDDVDGFEMQWACKTMVYYAFAKAQWNHEKVDYDTWFNDFCEKGFGKAAPEIKAYFELLEKLTDKAAALRRDYLETISDADMADLEKFIANARKLAANDPEVLVRIEFINKGLVVGKVCRKLHFAKKNNSPEFPALRKEFIRTIREFTLVEPAAVNPEKIGFYSPYLR